MLTDLLLSVLLGAARPRPEVEAAAVLHAWEAQRAAAWASADTTALRSLYVPGSPAGRDDVRMLAAWRDRGLRVEGLRTQLLAIEVRRAWPTRLDLQVADRLVGATAAGGGVRVPLPRDRVTVRRIVLVRSVEGEWRVAQSVEPAKPARTTSWTVRSRKE